MKGKFEIGMSTTNLSTSNKSAELQLKESIWQRTHNRVKNLQVEWKGDGVILEGNANSFHTKQLAQQAVHELFPKMLIRNRIVVKRSGIFLHPSVELLANS